MLWKHWVAGLQPSGEPSAITDDICRIAIGGRQWPEISPESHDVGHRGDQWMTAKGTNGSVI